MDETSQKSSLRVATLTVVLALGVLGVITWGIYSVVFEAWRAFSDLDKTVAVAIVTASATIVVSTLTVMIGRYWERKKERDALHRDKKIELYDEFLIEIFKLFANADDAAREENTLVDFLRESQRRLLLWSGPDVIRKYVEWKNALSADAPTVQSLLKMEKFFLALRKDLGHSNWQIKEGDMISFVLRHAALFLAETKKNPNLTLDELAELENKLSKDKACNAD